MDGVADQPEELLAIDADISRLYEHASTTEDVFAASLDMAQIDLLLERRHALTNPN